MVTREVTNKIIEMAEEGMISCHDLAFMVLKWMSEDDVANMLRANEVFIDEYENI